MIKNETGRSMVEMLGVLAIIGVLSVAGIAGYTMAMKKYKANEILNAASQTLILAQAKAETNGAPENAYNATSAGYTNVGGIPGANIVVNTSAKTVTINSDLGVQIKQISGCKIGNYNIVAGTECTVSGT